MSTIAEILAANADALDQTLSAGQARTAALALQPKDRPMTMPTMPLPITLDDDLKALFNGPATPEQQNMVLLSQVIRQNQAIMAKVGAVEAAPPTAAVIAPVVAAPVATVK